MKIKVEWQPEPGKWISQDVELHNSSRGNCYFKSNGLVYAFRDMAAGTPVVSKKKMVNGFQWAELLEAASSLAKACHTQNIV